MGTRDIGIEFDSVDEMNKSTDGEIRLENKLGHLHYFGFGPVKKKELGPQI